MIIYLYSNHIFLFNFSLKLECDKLATEKTEMQRHYVMVSQVNVHLQIIINLIALVGVGNANKIKSFD